MQSDAGTARAAALEDSVGAGELYPLVLVWGSSSLGLRRYGGIIGREGPIFVDIRHADQENFCPGLQSGLRQEIPWGRDPQILDVSGGPHHMLERYVVSSSSRGERRLSRWRVDASEIAFGLECF